MTGTEQPRRRSARGGFGWAAALLLLLLIAIFLPPLISLGHYRHSITASISAALGRPVYAGGMQLRLLPTPGISMTDFTVEEDPAFGYEPALHANSVVASLRLSSLWRGRLEVSRISLDEASLNVVRNSAGHWSLGSVLLRASQIPNAPTAQRHAGATPRFPYIEASDARINFKQGVEKKPFSLLNAEFSMWQASSGEWRLRLQAQPVRTDLELHLSDTGQVNVEGSLRRAADLGSMPLDLRAEWTGAQLGQVSRLLAGFDSGWRGDLNVTAAIRGSASNLQLRSRLRIGSLRRQEFQPPNTIDVDAACQSEYRYRQQALGNITCFWPVGPGHLLLTGNVEGGAAPGADLSLELNQIPASFPLTVLGLMRPHAQNVTAAGAINGGFRLATGAQPSLSGEATTTAASLSWQGGTLALPALRFVASSPLTTPRAKTRVQPRSANVRSANVRSANVQSANAVQLQTFAIPFGEAQPLTIDARFTGSGFEMHAGGPASITRLLTVGGAVGLLGNSLNALGARGRADLNLTTKGTWLPPLTGGVSGIATTGSMHVQGVELHPGFLPAPVEIAAADVTLTPDQVSWQNAALHFQKLALRGSLQFPSVCSQPGACPAAFTLQAQSLDAAGLEAALAGRRQGFLGNFLQDALGGGQRADWPSLHGSMQCGTFTIGGLSLQNATASLALEERKLSIESLDAAALGGNLHAAGSMSLANSNPQWSLDVRLTGVHPSAAGAMFQEHWGSGTLNGQAKLRLTGYSRADLLSSASGDFRFVWQNGGFPAEAGHDPLQHFDRWNPTGTIGHGLLTIAGGGLGRSGRTTPVRGTISLDRHLDLTLETHRGPVRIGGTLDQPVLATAAAQ